MILSLLKVIASWIYWKYAHCIFSHGLWDDCELFEKCEICLSQVECYREWWCYSRFCSHWRAMAANLSCQRIREHAIPVIRGHSREGGYTICRDWMWESHRVTGWWIRRYEIIGWLWRVFQKISICTVLLDIPPGIMFYLWKLLLLSLLWLDDLFAFRAIWLYLESKVNYFFIDTTHDWKELCLRGSVIYYIILISKHYRYDISWIFLYAHKFTDLC